MVGFWEPEVWTNTFFRLHSFAVGILIGTIPHNRVAAMRLRSRVLLIAGSLTLWFLAAQYGEIPWFLSVFKVTLGYPAIALGAGRPGAGRFGYRRHTPATRGQSKTCISWQDFVRPVCVPRFRDGSRQTVHYPSASGLGHALAGSDGAAGLGSLCVVVLGSDALLRDGFLSVAGEPVSETEGSIHPRSIPSGLKRTARIRV